MGRRALGKIDPDIDFTNHLKIPDQLPRPWNAAAIFGRSAPLEIEVGSGRGLFLVTSGKSVPEHNFLGIEVAGKYASFAASRVAQAELPNVCLVHGDALPIFQEMLPDTSVAAVHVYFPDPWWKRRHRVRRVMNVAFAGDIERVLVPGGTLHFWSDVKEYFETTLELLTAQTSLSGPHPVAAQVPEHDLDYRTHFERRTRMHDEAVYRSKFRKSP